MPPPVLTRCLVAAAVAGPALLATTPAGAAPTSPTLQFDGRGAGHGVGLAQDSAQALAAAGSTREQVLARFYPHTGRTRRGGPVRVSVWQSTPGAQAVVISLPGGGEAVMAGRAVALPAGSRVRLWLDADGYHLLRLDSSPHHPQGMRAAFRSEGDPSADPSTAPTSDPTVDPTAEPTPAATETRTPDPAATESAAAEPTPTNAATPTDPAASDPAAGPSTTTAPAQAPAPTRTSDPAPGTGKGVPGIPVRLVPAAGSLLTVETTGRSYRGTLTLVAADALRLVNTVDVETYLQGLGEVPASWPAAALQAQAVAARTYALRAATAGRARDFDLCDDAHCQVYLGAGHEDPRTTAAARATRGEVVTFGGALATTYYSANAGGVTASPEEGLGGTAVPYLPSHVVAPGPVRPWSLRVTTADVATAAHYGGTLTAMTVARRGPSGRAVLLQLDGSAGRRTVPARAVASALGLPSTLFSVAPSALSATAPLSGGLATAGQQVSPDDASLTPVVAPLTVTPGDVPSSLATTITAEPVAEHGSDRTAALLVGVVVGAGLALLVTTSRRRMLASAPPETAHIDAGAAATPAPSPAPGRRVPTVWLTVGSVTVGSSGALAAVKLGRDQD